MDRVEFLLMGKKLYVLDWDGVIMETWPHIIQCFNAALEERGLNTDSVWKTKPTLKQALEATYPELDEYEIKNLMRDLRDKEKEMGYPLVEGAKEKLEKWKKEGKILAVCTTNENYALDIRIEMSGIDPSIFLAKNTSESKYSKPDGRAIESLIKIAGTKKSETVFIGDSTIDYKTAKLANVDFIAVLSGKDKKEDFTKLGLENFRIFKSIKELERR